MNVDIICSIVWDSDNSSLIKTNPSAAFNLC